MANWGVSIMDIKKWEPSFDPRKEVLQRQPVWVKISGMSMEVWNKEVLKALGGSLGKFIDVDKIDKIR